MYFSVVNGLLPAMLVADFVSHGAVCVICRMCSGDDKTYHSNWQVETNYIQQIPCHIDGFFFQKHLIQVTRVSQEVQFGVLEKFFPPWASDLSATLQEFQVLEEKYESLSINDSSDVVPLASGSGPES